MTIHNDVVKPALGRPRRRTLRVLLWAVVAGAAAGCTTPCEGRCDFHEGWRKAEVTRLDVFENLASHLIPRCESAMSSKATAVSSWAVVRYRAGRRSREVAVALAASGNYKVGELVYVNLSACSRAMQRRGAAS